MQEQTEEILLTIQETGRSLKIGRTKTYELIREGAIQSVKIGTRHLVLKASRDRYVASLVTGQRR